MYQKCTNPGGSATMSRKHGPKHSKHLLSRRHAVACSYGAVTCSFHQLPLSFLPHVVFAALCSICNSQIPAGETQEKTPAATQPKTSRSQVINADPLHNGQSMRKHPTLLVLCVRVPQLTEWPRGLLKARLHL